MRLLVVLFLLPIVSTIVFILLIRYMSFKSITGALYSRIGDAYNYLSDGEVSYGKNYAVLRHSRPFILYRGTKTNVLISVFGNEPLSSNRKVYLQRRGWRTGLFGWAIGGLLGGSHYPGIDVTPVVSSTTTNQELSQSEMLAIKNDITRLLSESTSSQYPHQQTLCVHIPVASGDGYFRLVITTSPSSLSVAGIPSLVAASPVFRVGSIAFSSAHPRGASLLGLVPELLARSLFVAGKTAAYAAFYAAFPFLKVATWIPGPWKQWALQMLYNTAGGEERFQLQSRVDRMNQSLKKANDKLYKSVPFGAVGVRTAADLLKDDELGRQGFYLGADVLGTS